jgi:hypothetical protein
MIRFKKYLAEAKNVHQIHLEQNALMGVVALRQAILMVRDLRDQLRGSSSSKKTDVTVKWDGAPAIFAGQDPDTKNFFVSTKGLFSKTPKMAFDKASLKQHFGDSGALPKLEASLKYLKKLGIKGILQGDLLFGPGDVKTKSIDGRSYYLFRPNTIAYAVPVDSPIGKRIASAKIGIVFHTSYSGKDVASLSSSHNINISGLAKSKDVFYTDAYLSEYSGTLNFTKAEDLKVTNLLSDILKDFKVIKRTTYDGLKDHGIFPIMEIFNNDLVRRGKTTGRPDAYLKEFKRFWEARVKKKAATLKTQKGQDKHINKMRDDMAWFDKHGKEIGAMISIYAKLWDIKLMFVNKFGEIDSKVKSFVETGKGYKATKPEGYVAIHGGNVVKLVDRLEFSHNNFNVAKNWK